jgi:hypothetical protein
MPGSAVRPTIEEKKTQANVYIPSQ